MGLWRRFCILLPPRAKGCRAGARNIPAGGMKGTSNGPSGTPAPTGCVYLGAPVFGKPPIWTQQSHCTITDRRVSAWGTGAAAIRGVHAIRCTAISIYFGFRGVRGGVYDAVSRAGGLETCGFKQTFWSLLGLRPKVTRARGAELSPLGTWWKHERAVGDAGPYGVRHCRAVRGSGSGSYRRVPEPVIARHPRGAWERQRG